MEESNQRNQGPKMPPERQGGSPAKISKQNKTLLLIGVVLLLALIIFLVLMFQKPPTQKVGKEKPKIAPEKHLSEFINSNLTEYYQPAVVQPVETQKNTWEYRWGVDQDKVLSFIDYNKDNNQIRRKVALINTFLENRTKKFTSEDAKKLSSQILTYTVPNWECDSMTIELTADPTSGKAPLENVDLTAKVTGSIKGTTTYKFDCESDETIDKTVTTNQSSFTAKDLCSYPEDREYSAGLIVSRKDVVLRDSTDPEPKTVYRCRSSWKDQNKKYELILYQLKNLKNVTAGLCIRGPQSADYEKNTCIRN